jgi:hypothetical protein
MVTSDFLFQASDQIFVVGVAFDKLRQMLPVLHEVDASSFLMTKKILSAASPVASLMTRSRPAERARFCSSERPYRMSQEIIDIGILLS